MPEIKISATIDPSDLARRAYQALYQAARQARYRQTRDATPYPTPEEIIAARQSVGLTQGDAATIVYTTDRHWSNWERGVIKMPKATWRLFRLLTGLETISPEKTPSKTHV